MTYFMRAVKSGTWHIVNVDDMYPLCGSKAKIDRSLWKTSVVDDDEHVCLTCLFNGGSRHYPETKTVCVECGQEVKAHYHRHHTVNYHEHLVENGESEKGQK